MVFAADQGRLTLGGSAARRGIVTAGASAVVETGDVLMGFASLRGRMRSARRIPRRILEPAATSRIRATGRWSIR